MALKRGLTEAVTLGITHISICCDHHQIFELVLGRSVPEKDSIALLMEDVERIRQQLTSTTPVLVTGNQTKSAYKLAMETLVSEISICMPPHASDDQKTKKKDSCRFCFEDGFEAEQMFYVAVCRHQFCVECMKHYVENSLLRGCFQMKCPKHDCSSELTIKSCANLLSPKLRDIWEKKIKKGSMDDPWHECKKCQHMNENSSGNLQVTCRK
ncbi:unnamed protein product [Microthlaspi erraticum]|nr:unnamed protein product [Microthlaspi erraticum]